MHFGLLILYLQKEKIVLDNLSPADFLELFVKLLLLQT